MTGIHSCANCHSFSSEGRYLGMDVDMPQNDKGLYALTPVGPVTHIRQENIIAWSTFSGKLSGKLRVGFMSQVSPDGRFVVTTINDPGPHRTPTNAGDTRRTSSPIITSPISRTTAFSRSFSPPAESRFGTASPAPTPKTRMLPASPWLSRPTTPMKLWSATISTAFLSIRAAAESLSPSPARPPMD